MLHPETAIADDAGWPTGAFGTATLTVPGAVIAGDHSTWQIQHVVGPYGVDDAGAFKLLWSVQADAEVPQFDDPSASGYVSVRTDGSARLSPRWAPRASVRPWSKGIVIEVVDGSLAAGDVVDIVVGDRDGGGPGARAQSFADEAAALRLLVDPFATGVFRVVPGELGFTVMPGPVHRLIATARVGGPAAPDTLSVRAVDRHGNVATGYRGTVSARLPGDETLSLVLGEDQRGVATAPLSVERDGPVRVEVVDDAGRRAVSNPLPARDTAAPLWGDTQGQTGETVGAGTIESFFSYAREVARLDFVAHSANDFQIDGAAYAASLRACDAATEDGDFVAFGGFEWSGNTPTGGDHNVLFADTSRAPLTRSSHALVEDVSDLSTDARTAADLYRAIDGLDAICVPHVGGRRVAVDLIDPRHAPVLEIVSVHGWFEWLALDALRAGHAVGVVGASDDHSGRPGASAPTSPAFGTRNGLAGVYAEGATGPQILQALRERRCYATTGDRMLLDVRAGEHPMGSHWSAAEAPRIVVRVSGTAPVEAVEVLGPYGPIARWDAPGARSRDRLRVAWRGARVRDRRRTQPWHGGLEIRGARILSAQTWCFDHPDQGITAVDDHRVAWRSTTNGDADGVELLLDGEPDSVLFDAGDVRRDIDLRDMADRLELAVAGGVDRALTLTRPHETAPATDVLVEFDGLPFSDGRNAYLVKVHQADGQLAWASPLFVDRIG